MKCQKCGIEIPENKIYCENCGNAVQIVPDYNPMEDIPIGKEDYESELKKEQTEENIKQEIEEKNFFVYFHRWKYLVGAVLLVGLGVYSFQTSYHRTLASTNKEDKTDKTDKKEEITGIDEAEEASFLEKPKFSLPSGVYSYTPRLTISHPDRKNGSIYYTTNGTTPDSSSYVYDNPIEILEGKTVIRAVFIRSDGEQSEENDATYEIIFNIPDEPQISLPSGTYYDSFQVSLSAQRGCKIYYTTNGEEPGYQSNLYEGEITIPAGHTVLQAVAVDEEGGMSGIVEAIYNVNEKIISEE